MEMSGKGSGWYAAGLAPGLIATNRNKGGTSVDIPSFSKPAVPTFRLPGFGQTTYGDNAYGLQLNPEQEAYQQQVKALRGSILSGLGITSPEREASLNQWQDTFQREAARTTMPQLEQTLFSRGLGGSNFYQGAITDLLSKIATQGVLGREDLANRDEQLKLAQLGQIAGLDQTALANMSDLIGMGTNQYNSDYGNALNLYGQQLPYLASVTKRGDPFMGALQGGVQGLMLGGGNPWAAAAGAGIGAIGNSGSTKIGRAHV